MRESALTFRAPWRLEIRDRRIEPLGPHQVRVEIRATGICGTDLAIATGDYAATPGVVLGHESTGVVAEVGAAVRTVAIGARVVIDPTYQCGRCRMCRTGRPNHCVEKLGTEAGVSANGTFARTFVTTPRFIHRLPDSLSDVVGTLTEPLSCVLTGLARLVVHPELRCAVIGAGPIGLLAAWALAARGLSGWIIERAPARAALAAACAPTGWSVAEDPARIQTDDDDLDVVVDTTGCAAASALPRLARGGQLLVLGLRRSRVEICPGMLADRSVSIIGSVDSNGTFATALDMLARDAVPGRRLITASYPLAAYRDAFVELGCDLVHRRQAPPRALKLVLTP